MNGLALYARLIRASVRGQMQYRAAFLLQTVGHFLITGIEVVGLWALFDRFHGLAGWTLPEVALLYGMVNIAFALVDGAARGFDSFGGLVSSGGFDLLLVRPRSTVLQLAGAELQLRRIGRLTQAVLVLGWASSRLKLHWGAAEAATLTAAILGGACLFYGLIICQATFCFWTVESLELFNIVTYGGVETAQYPVAVYRSWFRRIFTYVVPVAAVTYFPALAILGRTDPLGSSRGFQYCAPGLGLVFLLVSLRVWEFGVRHYRSTGS